MGSYALPAMSASFGSRHDHDERIPG
jgi:hypothetical protein